MGHARLHRRGLLRRRRRLASAGTTPRKSEADLQIASCNDDARRIAPILQPGVKGDQPFFLACWCRRCGPARREPCGFVQTEALAQILAWLW